MADRIQAMIAVLSQKGGYNTCALATDGEILSWLSGRYPRYSKHFLQNEIEKFRRKTKSD